MIRRLIRSDNHRLPTVTSKVDVKLPNGDTVTVHGDGKIDHTYRTIREIASLYKAS